MSYFVQTRAPMGPRRLGRHRLRGMGAAVVSQDTLSPIISPIQFQMVPIWNTPRGINNIHPIISPLQPISTIAPVTQQAPTPVPTTPAPTLQTPGPITTSGIVPVPVGQSTAAPYVAPDGSVWAWSTSSGAWQEVYGANSTLASAVAAGQTEVASDGSVWTYNPSTGTWVQTSPANSALASASAPAPPSSATPTVATSDYQSVLDWLQQDTLLQTLGIQNIPNWIAALGLGLVVYKFMQRGKK